MRDTYEVYSMKVNSAGDRVRIMLLGYCQTLDGAVLLARANKDVDADIFTRSGKELLSVAWDKPQPQEAVRSKVRVFIGRSSGPCTDKEVSADFSEAEIQLVKDVLAMVNQVSSNKEQWYLTVGAGEQVIIPVTKEG